MYKDRDWLYQKYVVELRSSNEIAEMCGVNSQTILNWLAKFNIPTNSQKQYANKRKTPIFSTCLVCGTKFEVSKPSEADPNNKRKFKRCCSPECTSKLKSNNAKRINELGLIKNRRTGPQKFLDEEVLKRLYCYEHKKIGEIAKELHSKYTTVSRELKRLGLKGKFIMTCPNCLKEFEVPMRSMTDPNSNKYKKFCSRKCFLSSRKQTDTWIEQEIETFLLKHGISYDKQVPIERMTVDFLITNTNLVIEANGDFWHANPEIYGKIKPLHKIHPRVIRKDKIKMKQLDSLGYKVFIVWENDLANKKEETLNRLYDFVMNAH